MAAEKAERMQSPLNWAWPLTLVFGAAQMIAGVIFFFAYNWRDLPDIAKIALPQGVMVLGFLIFAILPKTSALGRIAGIVAVVMIGISMGVVGQVYQLGADPWRLFAVWAVLAAIITAVLRDHTHFALTFAITSIAYFLYTDQELRNFLPQPNSSIPAVYALGGLSILLVYEMVTGGAERWLRWLMAAAVLIVVTVGALLDVYNFDHGKSLFVDGWIATASLFISASVIVALFRSWRIDKPVLAMALFAAAVFIGAFGIRILLFADADGAGDVSLLLFVGAGWVISVTSVLAITLRRFVGGNVEVAS